jgi:hypothetical protein
MSLLIEDDLIWVSIPKCASTALEYAIVDSNLDYRIHSMYKDFKNWHGHVDLKFLYDEFGYRETICIKRDWFERWLSSLEYFFYAMNKLGNKTIIEWEDVDNSFIYKTFEKDYMERQEDNIDEISLRFIKKPVNDPKHNRGLFKLFFSQKYWKLNKPCTYEFDINELYKMEDFIYNRYGKKIVIKRLNDIPKIKNKIIINNELKQFVWDIFEKPFDKNTKLL